MSALWLLKKVGASDIELAPTWNIETDARRTWVPTQWGGAYAPYKCFRPGRKPWRRGNSFAPSILITKGWSRPLGGGTQNERHASQRAFRFGAYDQF